MEERQKSGIKLTKLASCAGCGAKVGAGELSRLLSGLPARHDVNLLVGFDKSDDAAVYRVDEGLAIVQTVDFFPPIADDPYTFGKIAATNALSDIYAMGGEPKTALNILVVPEDMDKEHVHAILRGGYDAVYEAGAVIAGGHSIYGPEPKYGLSVMGYVNPERMWQNSGAKPDDVLLFTKALGTGVLATAQKAGLLPEGDEAALYASMTSLNRAARDVMTGFTVHACTDVTGFSLIGHALEMAEGSGVCITITPGAVALLPGAEDFAKMGLLPEGMYRNRRFCEARVSPGDTSIAMQDILYGPETSGGLLFAVPEADAEAALCALMKKAPEARRIGYVSASGKGTVSLENH